MPPTHWQSYNLTARLLLPISWLYGKLLSIQAWCFRCHFLKTTKLTQPVIVVGNVVAGGVGKTPIVMAIVKHLQRLGYSPGVVSRGYGRKSKACIQVGSASKAMDVGDEPLLIFKLCRVPVVVAADRVLAATTLLANNTHCNVIVSDDGLQHRALGRDIEIIVFDERGVGNGHLLPSGPLRERWPRSLFPEANTQLILTAVKRTLENHAANALGATVNLLELAMGSERPVHAIAGIAKPEQFFQMLRQKGIRLASSTHYADHASLDHLNITYPLEAIVLCTEKDAVKVWAHAPEIFAVPLKVELDSMFLKAFDASIKNLLHFDAETGPEAGAENSEKIDSPPTTTTKSETNLDYGQQTSGTTRMPTDQRPLAF